MCGAYSEEAAVFDQFLDKKIALIRDRQNRGEITCLEAAAERVAALEHHLAAVRALRTEYFGHQAS